MEQNYIFILPLLSTYTESMVEVFGYDKKNYLNFIDTSVTKMITFKQNK